MTSNVRFKEARERLGLSPDEVAKRSGISTSVWDIEAFEGELTSCHSPNDIAQFCRVLKISPTDLFGNATDATPISADELVRRIHDHCLSRAVTLEQFEDTVGWRLAGNISTPNKLLDDMTVDGLQWLCRELGVDWRRVLLGLCP